MPCFLLNTLIIQIYIAVVGEVSMSGNSGKAFSLAFTFLATILLSGLVNNKFIHFSETEKKRIV